MIGARRAGHLVPVPAVSDRNDRREPLAAPLARHLSAAGRRRLHSDGARRRGGGRAQRAQHRAVDLADRLRAVARAVVRVRSRTPPTSSSSSGPSWVTIGGFEFNYHMGIDGISLFFVLLSTLLTVLSHRLRLGSDPVPGQGIHDRLPRPRDADGRHLLRARFRPVLRVLRGRADPDVPDHRGLGRARTGSIRRSSSFSTRCSARC